MALRRNWNEKAAQANYSTLSETEVPGKSSRTKAAQNNHPNLMDMEVPGNSSTKKAAASLMNPALTLVAEPYVLRQYPKRTIEGSWVLEES